jgi:hypothetical protein
MILNFKDFIFESEVKSKNQIKRELWHQNNPSPTGTNITTDDLPQYGVPDSIIEMMKKWPVIHKSPYSKSFYSSDDISWSHKPDESYRVSDHWNFITNRSNKRHCKTSEPVKNVTHYSIGKYDKTRGIYDIILSEITTIFDKKMKDHEEKLKYLQDPETIYKKKLFKDNILKGDVFAEFTVKGKEYSGQVDKYTGNKIILKNDKGEIIFTDNKFEPSDISLMDKNGNIISNPF